MTTHLTSIIIVNYNTEQLLINCIESVYKETTGIPFEIIVVDNNSQEHSLDSIESKYPDVRYIHLPENIGFGRANNKGAEIAKGEYLFFLNPDTILANNAIQILHTYMQNNQQVGVCGGNLYDNTMQPQISYHTLDFYNREFLILLQRPRRLGFNHSNKPMEVKVIMGADLLIRKSIFDEIKGFDPDFFLYFEEVYLCDNVRKLGYKVVSLPDAHIIHMEGLATTKKSEELNKWSYREHWYSKFVYFSKTKGRTATSFIYNVHKLKQVSAKLIYTLMFKNKQKKEYWEQKQDVLNKTYGRYREYLKHK